MIFPRPLGRVQQAMQKESHKVGMARAPPPHWACLQKANAHGTDTQPAPRWNAHTTGSFVLPSSCISLRNNCSWKTVKFFTTAICCFSACISTQADKVKKLSFSEPTFLCSDTDCGMLMKRQQFSLSLPCSRSKNSNLSYLIWGEYRKDWEIMV